MKLTFELANKEFDDALAVSVNGETQEVTEENKLVSFNIEETEEAIVQILYVRNDMSKIKHPLGRFFMWLFVLLLSPVAFFCDNDNGIGIHKFFYGAKPFGIKKIFYIKPTEDVISVNFLSPKYNKETRSFSDPDVVVSADKVKEKDEICYNPLAMKTDFRVYHYPAYTVLFALILALGSLMGLTLRNQFQPFDLAGVIGMSFCCVVMLALLIVFICLFVSTHRLFREIDRNLNNYQEK